ncbi:MAG: hypothetical protein WAO58_00030 [Fimbriimonadaceae bacterium]
MIKRICIPESEWASPKSMQAQEYGQRPPTHRRRDRPQGAHLFELLPHRLLRPHDLRLDERYSSFRCDLV